MTIPAPKWDAPLVDGNGRPSRPWYAFLTQPDATTTTTAEQPEYKLVGPLSIVVQGLLQNGLASVALKNDQLSPDALSFYGTDEDGAKGWHSLMPRVMARLSMRL